MANWKRSFAGVPIGLIAIGVLAGCFVERTTRETTVEGTWTPADLELPPGCSLSIEDATTHEAVSIGVAADGRVHAERASGARYVVVDAESFDSLRRDHPEIVDALRAFRVDYRISTSLTTVDERD